MVRYVDDLYILFNSDKPENTLTPVINRVIDTYSSELKKINLSLNRVKHGREYLRLMTNLKTLLRAV